MCAEEHVIKNGNNRCAVHTMILFDIADSDASLAIKSILGERLRPRLPRLARSKPVSPVIL